MIIPLEEMEEGEGMDWFLKLQNLNEEGVPSEKGKGEGVEVVIEIGIEDGMIEIGIGMIGGIVIDVIATAIVTVIGIGIVREKVTGTETEIGRGIERGISKMMQ